MPIPLGIIAVAGASAASASAYDLLETTLITTNTATVTFSSLGSYSNYKHLHIRAVIRSYSATVGDRMTLQLNGLAGTNYAEHRMFGNGSSITNAGAANQDKIQHLQFPANNGTANSFSVLTIDILDFLNTSKFKTIRTLMGGYWDTKETGLVSGLVKTTNAISSIDFKAVNSGYGAGSRFSLYGLK